MIVSSPARPSSASRPSARSMPTLAATLLWLGACGPPESATPDATIGGQALFDATCAECHGQRARGDGPMAASLPVSPPSLFQHLGHHPRAQLVRLIQEGVPPAMPPAPLTEEQILEVVEYTWTLVPDSMVAALREMQRMAEMGMDMDDMDMGGMGGTGEGVGGSPTSSGMGMGPEAERASDASGHAMHADTIGS
jgi:mono/diheme cytochrome c family protein